jgi:phosphoribosylglycinamide formyltransferase 1
MDGPLPVGILASGEGSTLDGLARGAGRYRIAVVVVDRAGAGAVAVARRHGLAVVDVGRPGARPDPWGDRITSELERNGVLLVVLAGFLSILPSSWTDRWRGRAVNLHPSLLPRYGGAGMHGLRVHAEVIAAGERETGATVHLVTGDVDGGPSVARARVPVLPGDTAETLRDRLRPVEIDLLVRTVDEFASGRRPLPYPGGDERPAADRAPADRRD